MLLVKIYGNVIEDGEQFDPVEEWIWSEVFNFKNLKENTLVIVIPSRTRKSNSSGSFANPLTVEVSLVDDKAHSSALISEGSEIAAFLRALSKNGWVVLYNSDLSVRLEKGPKSK